MMPQKFVHLHLRTEYSLVDSTIRIDDLMKHLKALNVPSVAITDYMNLFAIIKFYRSALNHGIKPIIGCEASVWSDDLGTSFNLVLLCKNMQGYYNLTHLVSKAYQLREEKTPPSIKSTWFEQHTAGLIALSGLNSDVGSLLLQDKKDEAVNQCRLWKEIFEDYYLQVARINHPDEQAYIVGCQHISEKLSLPLIASNDVRFLLPEQYEAHEARVCIQKGELLADQSRKRNYTIHQSVKTNEEMHQLFSDMPNILENTAIIAKKCNVHFELDNVVLPDFPIPNQLSIEDYLKQQVLSGLDTKELETSDYEKYHSRVERELLVINKMGYAGYFLIVADFITWARNHRIPVGPGRGSGAGSLVAFSLGITDIDPLKYNLLFERFLNPERISMPDFDIDFCMDNRDRVIEYVMQKYGKSCVSQIITFGKMAAKAVIRDVGRVLGHSYGFVDRIAKLIPNELGVTLSKALKDEKELSHLYKTDDTIKTMFDLAIQLEGLARNAGKHAGGVVIAPGALTNYAPLYCEENDASIVTQFDKDDVESIGLIKFDFLGLRTLTIIDRAVKTVNKSIKNKDKRVDIKKISLDDAKTFELIQSCNTTSIFQLESRGMKELVGKLKPDCFEDVVALIALFRPGPLQSGMVDDFIDRKHGKSPVTFFDPRLETVLSPTYGVILYQEQVMQIAQVLAGYSLGKADLLRRAMGKKKVEEMAKQRLIFVSAAVNNNVSHENATTIFDLIEKFAGYGFNKSHSVAYAMISYQTAWLKAHYPSEFMAAVLSSDMDNTDKLVTIIHECKSIGLEILPPDINSCHYFFTAKSNGSIAYGLGAIKGLGQGVIESLTFEREKNGEYKNLLDFCTRLDVKKIGKRVLHALIYSGGFDNISYNRATLLDSVDASLLTAEQSTKNDQKGQLDMFGISTLPNDEQFSQKNLPEIPKIELLAKEKQILGYYVSGHPVDVYSSDREQLGAVTISDLINRNTNSDSAWSIGLISQIRRSFTKRKDPIYFLTIESDKNHIEAVLFSDLFDKAQDYIKKENIILFKASATQAGNEKALRYRLLDAMDLQHAREQYAEGLQLKIDFDISEECSNSIKKILCRHPKGKCPVLIQYNDAATQCTIALDRKWDVLPTEELCAELSSIYEIQPPKYIYQKMS